MEQTEFNEIFRNRTKSLAVRIIKMYRTLPKSDENVIIGKQIIRSATSVATNYRAVCRARSVKERFAKLSIVVEEADETLLWLEMLEDAEIVKPEKLIELKKETAEILSVMAKARKNTQIT